MKYTQKKRVIEREKRKMREKRWKSRSVSIATDPFSQLTVDKSIGATLGPETLRRGLIEAGLPLLLLLFGIRGRRRQRNWKERRAWENRRPSNTAFFYSWLFPHFSVAARFRYQPQRSPPVCFQRERRLFELTIIGGAIFERYSGILIFMFRPLLSSSSPPLVFVFIGIGKAGILFSVGGERVFDSGI